MGSVDWAVRAATAADADRARAFYSRHGWRSDEVVDQYRFQGAEMTVLRYSRELR